MNFAIIIPDRSDRPELTEHCFYQINRQTVKPEKIYHINYLPLDDSVDLVSRIQKGIQLAKNDGINKVAIIENDDYYPDNYLESIIWRELTGILATIYINIIHDRHKVILHPGRSSLFCTALEISAFEDFEFPGPETIDLDKHIWRHKCFKILHYPKELPIGIKHGIGKCAGWYHNNALHQMKPLDEDLFKYYVKRKESRDFYRCIKNSVNSA